VPQGTGVRGENDERILAWWGNSSPAIEYIKALSATVLEALTGEKKKL